MLTANDKVALLETWAVEYYNSAPPPPPAAPPPLHLPPPSGGKGGGAGTTSQSVVSELSPGADVSNSQQRSP